MDVFQPQPHSRSEETLSGVVERITFHSEESGWSVLRVRPFRRELGELVTVVLHQAQVFAGATVEFNGYWKEHPKFGRQFSAKGYLEKKPASASALEKYLGSGLIYGVGPKTAKKIVSHFGEKTLDVFEDEIDALLEVPGIAKKKLCSIQESWDEHRRIRDVMIFLQGHGISTLFALKIFKQYGQDSIDVLNTNPYRLAKDIFGIGFHSADQLALKLGLDREGEVRVSAAIRHLLMSAKDEGHCYLLYEQLYEQGKDLLGFDWEEQLGAQLLAMQEQKNIRVRQHPVTLENCYYHNRLYFDELAIRDKVGELARSLNVSEKRVKDWIKRYENATGFQLGDEQRVAVVKLSAAGFGILTGGPGCGKTTTTKTFVELLKAMKKTVVLAAPTGRAAQRMSEVIGLQAKTIHRLLEFDPKRMGFKRSEDYPLEGDAFIFDECSMLDVNLAADLLKAIPPGAQVLFVGDQDQLPSVGPGQVLRDLIDSEQVVCCRLQQVHRQDDSGKLIKAAHKINRGEFPKLDNPFEKINNWKRRQDLFFLDADEPTTEQMRFFLKVKRFLEEQKRKGESFQIAREKTTEAFFEGEHLMEKDVQAISERPKQNSELVVPEKFFRTNLEGIFSSESESEALLQALGKVPPFSSLHYGMTCSETVVKFYEELIAKAYGSLEIQILCPMTRGRLGTHYLNEQIQKRAQSREQTPGIKLTQERSYHVGDRVIQKRNNYDLNVFNGDIGTVLEVAAPQGKVTVAFGKDESANHVVYQKEQLFELELAYAITIHKSQGSEFDAVILPVAFQHFKMLYRNLIYTGMTRGKKLVLMLGQRKALYMAIKQEQAMQRQTMLEFLLRSS